MISNAYRPTTLSYDYESYTTPARRPSDEIDISFVIPVFNEEESIEELAKQIDANVPVGMSFEIIFILSLIHI